MFSSMFSSMSNVNYRLFMIGQGFSMAGTAMQAVAQSWLVLKLTGSGTALGLVVTLQYLPVLLFGGHAGVLLDRVDRRRLLLIVQVVGGGQAAALGILVITGSIQLPAVYGFAVVLGFINCIEQPLRQTFIFDVVEGENVSNAISLSMALGNISKFVGPALAGVVIGAFGLGPCFFLNSASFVAMIITLVLMRIPGAGQRSGLAPAAGQFSQGLRYVRSSPGLLGPLVVLALMFGLSWQFEVLLPLLARFSFHGGAGMYGSMSSAVALGCLVGGLLMASLPAVDDRMIMWSLVALAAGQFALAVTPWYPVCLIILACSGAAGITAAGVCNALLQVRSSPEMRGRIMGLYAIAIIGTRPIGGPLVGSIAQHTTPRWCLMVCGAVVLLVTLPVCVWFSTAEARAARAAEGPVLVHSTDFRFGARAPDETRDNEPATTNP